MILKRNTEIFYDMLEVDNTILTEDEFIQEYNIIELEQKGYDIQLEDADKKKLMHKFFLYHNAEELPILHKIFNESLNDDVWDILHEKIEDNILTAEVVEHYLILNPDKMEALKINMENLNYGKEYNG